MKKEIKLKKNNINPLVIPVKRDNVFTIVKSIRTLMLPTIPYLIN